MTTILTSPTHTCSRVKIMKSNGGDLEANDALAPTNYFLHSLFSQVDISLNGTQVTTSTNTYAYRSMIEAVPSYGGDANQSQLTSGLFYKDDAGRMHAVLRKAPSTRISCAEERRQHAVALRILWVAFTPTFSFTIDTCSTQ